MQSLVVIILTGMAFLFNVVLSVTLIIYAAQINVDYSHVELSSDSTDSLPTHSFAIVSIVMAVFNLIIAITCVLLLVFNLKFAVIPIRIFGANRTTVHLMYGLELGINFLGAMLIGIGGLTGVSTGCYVGPDQYNTYTPSDPCIMKRQLSVMVGCHGGIVASCYLISYGFTVLNSWLLNDVLGNATPSPLPATRIASLSRAAVPAQASVINQNQVNPNMINQPIINISIPSPTQKIQDNNDIERKESPAAAPNLVQFSSNQDLEDIENEKKQLEILIAKIELEQMKEKYAALHVSQV